VTSPNPGVLSVAVVALLGLLALALFDAWFNRRSGQPVGRWVQAWARRFPVLAFVLVAVLGALIGHFYWSTPGRCPTAASGQAPASRVEPDCIRQPAPRQPPAP
jgi:hypothetical protein